MYQIDVATAAAALPTPAAPGTEGFFTDGNPASGLPATIVDADFMNMLMMELINLVEAGGLTPSKTAYNQVLLAIKNVQQGGQSSYAQDTSTSANTITLALTPAVTAYVDGMPIRFKAANNNTGATQINWGGGAVPLQSAAGALQGGEIVAGKQYAAIYNATTNAAVLIGQAGGATPVNAPTQSEHAAQLAQVQTDSLNYGVAGGTADALTVTLPAGVTALTDGFPVTVKLAYANATTTPTLAITIGTTAISALTIVKGANAALAAGDLPGAGAEANFVYSQSLGKLVLMNPATGVNVVTGGSVRGTIENFKSAVPGLNSYTTVLTADEVALENGSNLYITARNVNLTVNANGTVGAPLSVTSARTASTWYYRWLWYNATNGLTATLDTSSTAPTAPTGYASTDYKCKLPGASRTDSSGSTYLLNTETLENRSRYVVLASSNVPNIPLMAYGAQSAWTAVATGAFIPPNAASIVLATPAFASTGQIVAVAPSNAYGAYNSSTNPPPLVSAADAGVANCSVPYDMVLESSNIYVAITGGGAGVSCLGWGDNS